MTPSKKTLHPIEGDVLVKPGQQRPGEGWMPRRKRRLPRPEQLISKRRSFEENALKVADVCAFNIQAETAFVYWLSEKLAGSKGEGKPPAWVVQNAAYELDISLDTAKRYLIKHTADRAEFHSDGRRVTLKGEQEK
jgi:hypothetical protein